MTGIQVAKPKTLNAVDRARLGWPLPLRRAHIEPRAIVYTLFYCRVLSIDTMVHRTERRLSLVLVEEMHSLSIQIPLRLS